VDRDRGVREGVGGFLGRVEYFFLKGREVVMVGWWGGGEGIFFWGVRNRVGRASNRSLHRSWILIISTGDRLRDVAR